MTITLYRTLVLKSILSFFKKLLFTFYKLFFLEEKLYKYREFRSNKYSDSNQKVTHAISGVDHNSLTWGQLEYCFSIEDAIHKLAEMRSYPQFQNLEILSLYGD
jgi:hypothetical protein